MAGIFGVLLASNSELILLFLDKDYKASTTFKHYKTDSVALKSLVAFVGIVINVFWAYAMVIQKKVKHVPGIKISLFLGIEMLFTSAVAYMMGFFTHSGLFVQSFFFSGLGIAMCQILFISALNMTKNTGLLTLLIFIYIIPSYIISFFRYNEPLNPFCITGIGFMLYGLYTAIFNKEQQ